MDTCPNCQNALEPGAVFCDNCGHRVTALQPGPAELPPTQNTDESGMVTCPTCSTLNIPGTAFCDNCGTRMAAPLEADVSTEERPPPRPPVTPEAPTRLELPPEVLPSPTPPTSPEAPTRRRLSDAPVPRPAPVSPEAPTRLELPEAPPPPELPDKIVHARRPETPAPDDDTWPGRVRQPPAPPPFAPAPPPPEPPTRPSAPPPSGTIVGRFVVDTSGVTVPIPPGKTEVVLGREDPVSEAFPEIDLTPHNAERDGVSRLHARLTLIDEQVHVEDLHSTNYTFVNNERLRPGQHYPLEPGDRLRLGRLKLTYRQP